MYVGYGLRKVGTKSVGTALERVFREERNHVKIVCSCRHRSHNKTCLSVGL